VSRNAVYLTLFAVIILADLLVYAYVNRAELMIDLLRAGSAP
jgi:hypothetical protein